MFPPKTILFPVDFSARCAAAAPMVETIAGRFEASLILLHAAPLVDSAYGVPMVDVIGPATDQISEYMRDDLKHFSVERLVMVGDAAHAIAEVARNRNVDLIMMPTHGYGPFRKFVLGSVTARVLNHVECPVWTTAHAENTPPLEKISFRSILAAVDFGPQSPCVVKWAAALAEETDAKLTLVHSVPVAKDVPNAAVDQDFKNERLRDAEARARRLLNSCGVGGAAIHVFADDVSTSIAEAAREFNADMVVIGRSPAAGLGRLRKHGYRIIRESPVPVLSV